MLHDSFHISSDWPSFSALCFSLYSEGGDTIVFFENGREVGLVVESYGKGHLGDIDMTLGNEAGSLLKS